MKNIDGYVTKDSLYRLLSNMRMNREIDDNASSKVAQAVADMKPVDAQPVKHGRWIKHRIYDPKSILHGAVKDTTCSVCGKSTPYNTEYCQNCGARMDLKEDKDNGKN